MRQLRFSVILLAVLAIWSAGVGPAGFLGVQADDAAEGEEEGDTTVEDEPVTTGQDQAEDAKGTAATAGDKDMDAEEEIKPVQIEPSPDAEVTFLFTMPPNSKDLVVGKLTKFLIGFYNKGEKDFHVSDIETSFRYHMDFNYNLHNFSVEHVDAVVQPKHESTFEKVLFPHEQFSGRPLGLYVNVKYKDADGNKFQSAAFNETITIIEDDAGFNTETLFLYIVFACIVVLLLLGGQHFLSKMRRKHGILTKRQHYTAPVETGTSNKHEVDFEWIPKNVLEMNKSPKAGSPRNRRVRRGED